MIVSPQEQKRLHGFFADTYTKTTESGRSRVSLPDKEDSYGWRWLGLHLARAERFDDLHVLATRGDYLQDKIDRIGTEAAIADLALLPTDVAIQQLVSALRLSAHILDRESGELSNQLEGRLGSLAGVHELPQVSRSALRLVSQ